MALPIEDYAIIGDLHTAALVGRNGSIDWLCLPRFDAPACFAALLGQREQGFWQIAPIEAQAKIVRRYQEDTLILETEFQTSQGRVKLTDWMPITQDKNVQRVDVIRVVEGIEGEVAMRLDLVLRFDYGAVVPWVRKFSDGVHAIAGPDAVRITSSVPLRGEGLTTTTRFNVQAGSRQSFILTWYPAHLTAPDGFDALDALQTSVEWWRQWMLPCRSKLEPVRRSLITLKALTYAPTGGIVAAPTMGLPENIGGTRNWDYRYCWIRDATFTLFALMSSGFTQEATDWRNWLLRAAAGEPAKMQIMYSITGQRRLTEIALDWLTGYEGSLPVRVGNAAYLQQQLDVFGELVDVMYMYRRNGMDSDGDAWNLQRAVLEFLEDHWQSPDDGIWEIRGERKHFTHSKVMAWVAFDRAVKTMTTWGLPGPLERWTQVRDAIHAQVCAQGYSQERGSFVQSYGARELDASLLLLPLVGFLPPSDPRIVGTIEAIQKNLVVDGLVRRYETGSGIDGLPEGEGMFLACSFWLADALTLLGRHEEGRKIFEHIQTFRNDVGLLSEEYDPVRRRLVGNFPQAFSHVALINTATNIWGPTSSAEHRSELS